jgi:hypothetical protein
MPRLWGILFNRTIGVFPICWVIESIVGRTEEPFTVDVILKMCLLKEDRISRRRERKYIYKFPRGCSVSK